MPDEKYERIFGRPRPKKEDLKNKKNGNLAVTGGAKTSSQIEMMDLSKSKKKQNFDPDDDVRQSLIKS